eukprot:291035-Amphidinium_carterae.1
MGSLDVNIALACTPREEDDSLVRTFPLAAFRRLGPQLVTVLDASPFGIGGALYYNGKLHSALSSPLREEDFSIHGFSKGDAQGQQTWECLAVLVASRHWKTILRDETATWTIMTDNMTALHMMVNLTSRGHGPATIARELALEWSSRAWQPKAVEHLPGHMNEVADWLSRCMQPGYLAPKPQSLELMNLELPERRTRDYYRTLRQNTGRLEKSGVRVAMCVMPELR